MFYFETKILSNENIVLIGNFKDGEDIRGAASTKIVSIPAVPLPAKHESKLLLFITTLSLSS